MCYNLCVNQEVFNLNKATKYLSSLIEVDLQQQIVKNDTATLVLTGGNSIAHFFPELQKIQVLWCKVTLMLSDDRLVSVNDPASNESLIRFFLNDKEIEKNIKYISIKARFLENREEQHYDISAKLKQAVVVLSMGQDGHIASLFDYNDLLGETSLKYVLRPDFKRITLSYNTILSAYKIYIIIYGNRKIDFFKKTNINNFYLKDLFLRAEIILIKD